MWTRIYRELIASAVTGKERFYYLCVHYDLQYVDIDKTAMDTFTDSRKCTTYYTLHNYLEFSVVFVWIYSSKNIVDVHVRVTKICYIYKRVNVLMNITNLVLHIDLKGSHWWKENNSQRPIGLSNDVIINDVAYAEFCVTISPGWPPDLSIGYVKQLKIWFMQVNSYRCLKKFTVQRNESLVTTLWFGLVFQSWIG